MHLNRARTALLIAVLSISFSVPHRALAQRPTWSDGRPIAERVYVLPRFEELSPAHASAVTREGSRETYEAARTDGRFTLRKLEYASDGLRVVAYVYSPASTGLSLPAIVYCRGSYISGDEAPALLLTMHRLAEAGFVVVAPQYRQSDGGEGIDDLGGADVADVHNALRLAAGLPGVDGARLYLYGSSRGGMMTYQALRDGAPVRAAAAVGAFTDLDTLLASDPRSRAAALAKWPEFARDRGEIVRRRSAVYWADSLRVPVLMLHGASDPQVSPRQSERLASLLAAAGTPHELHIFPGGSHSLAEKAAARDSLVVDWFRRH